MIITNILRVLAPAAVLAVIISSCGIDNEGNVPPEAAAGMQSEEEEMTDNENFRNESAMHVSFKNGGNDIFEASDGWTNGNMFNVTWRGNNCVFEDGKMKLIIDRDKEGEVIPYSGGEYRTKDFYGYGRYEVRMKAIKNDGVVSSFFTYTGPSDNNQWDEIDIEILGKDTTQVQFNYFTSGEGNHEYVYDLGFDSSEDFHDYAFEWHKDRIVWFVDGEEVYTASENIPVTPGKIMMNAWCGINVDSWLKVFDDSSLPVAAEYESVSFTAFEE